MLFFCGGEIQKMWKKWNKNPVTIELSNRFVPISSIPFPTVTICAKTKATKDKLDLHSIYRDIEKLQHMDNNLTNLE